MRGRPIKQDRCHVTDCSNQPTVVATIRWFKDGKWSAGRTNKYCQHHAEILCEKIAKRGDTSVTVRQPNWSK